MKMLFTKEKLATIALLKLFSVVDVKISEEPNIQNTLKYIVIEPWERNKDQERWQLKLPKNLEKSADQIIEICHNDLSMNKEILPQQQNYDAVLFLGGTLSRVINRLEFYKELIKLNKIRKDLTLIVLTGDRDLSKDAGESKEDFLKIIPKNANSLPIPTNELEAIKFVFNYYLPKEIKVKYINSKSEKNYKRATTASTIVELAKDLGDDKNYKFLAISNQPYIEYQHSSINLTLVNLGKRNIIVETIGSKDNSSIYDKNNYAATLLNTIAQTIKNINKTL